jgi:hypothetical protein
MRLYSRFAGGILCAALLAGIPIVPVEAGGRDKTTVWILVRDGTNVEGEVESGHLTIESDGNTRVVGLGDLLSVQSASPASDSERERITADLAAVSLPPNKSAQEAAVAELSDIGLPALSPLLAMYKDTDGHEPKPLFRLFARIMPGYADRLDRTLDMVRLASGETIRGHVSGGDLIVATPDKRTTRVGVSAIRRIAVRRRTVDKTFDVDALRHCTPIEFLNSGVGVSSASRIDGTAQGIVRLSFDIDGWASDPDGLKVPGPNYKTNLVDGYPFGALVGRVGPAGARWLAGRHVQKSRLSLGRLYFAVNDNGHWQNNIGSFRVRLHATDAYDLGDPQ